MIDKLQTIESRYEELLSSLGTQEVQRDAAEYRRQAKALSDIEPIVRAFRASRTVVDQMAQAEELARGGDAEMRALAEQELRALEAERDRLADELRVLMLPRDPNDEKNVILEIRAGTGGEEAALFAAELFRMYSRFAERVGWSLGVMSMSEADQGGIREVIANIEGQRVYSRLKYESGVHRVQRVPETEASGRIHTSTATVAVLPEAEEVDVQIDAKDLRIDTFCSSGPGGQSVNTTYSAVRITTSADRCRRLAAGREVADQEPGEGHEGAARAALRDGDAKAAGSHRQGAARPRGYRRSLREDPDLQLPAEPHHRPPHQLHDPSADECAEWRSRGAARRGRLVLPGPEPEGRDRPEPALAGFGPAYERLVARRAAREPMAYIRGVQEFYGREFVVSPAVLIPRPETEFVVEEALACLREADAPPAPRVVDVGTGSGCIAVTIALEWPTARLVGTDISDRALVVAQANAQRHGVDARVAWRHGSYLVGLAPPLDLVVSNPPYVADHYAPALAPEVGRYEPHTALFGGRDGLRDVRALARQSAERLRPGGWLVTEIGDAQADAVRALVEGVPGLTLVRLRSDLHGIPRVAVVRRDVEPIDLAGSSSRASSDDDL
jgi:release factor-specific protein-(glutamine-N5) methyltransferase